VVYLSYPFKTSILPATNRDENSDSLPSNPIQPVCLDKEPSYRTQRGFTSLVRSVRDQAATLTGNIFALSQAASQVEGLDESATKLVLAVLRELECDIAAMSRSSNQFRSAVQQVPARDVPEEHAAYGRLGSSTPPQEKYRELVASSSGELFGLGYGSVDETRSMRDCTPSPTSLSASSSFAANTLTPAYDGRMVERATTPQGVDYTEAASSPPLSSLGGSFEDITQLLANQRLGHFSQETEENVVAAASAHTNEWRQATNSSDASNSPMTAALLALPSASPSPSSSQQVLFAASTPLSPETPVRQAFPHRVEPPSPSASPSPLSSKGVTAGVLPWLRTPPRKTRMSGPRDKIELNRVKLDHRAKRSSFIVKYAPTGARRPKARLAPVADAPAAVVNAQLETSGLPRPVLQLRGVAAGHRARLEPVHRKAMVIDGAALEVADVTFARSNASGSRVITGRTEVSAALDEMARSQNAATLAPVPTQPAPLTQPLVSSSIANTATSSGDVPRLTRAQSSKRKRELEAENVVAEEATPGEPQERTLAVTKSRARVVAFAEPSTSGKAARQDTSAEDMAAMERFCLQSASATVAFKGKPSSSKPKPRSGFLRR